MKIGYYLHCSSVRQNICENQFIVMKFGKVRDL